MKIIIIEMEKERSETGVSQTRPNKKEHLQDSTNERKSQVNPIFADIFGAFSGR